MSTLDADPARAEILRRIRGALTDVPSSEHGDSVPLSRNYRAASDEPRREIVTRFAERVAEYRAIVRWTVPSELPKAIEEACMRRGVSRLAVPPDAPDEWLPGDIEILRDRPELHLSKEQLDRSDGVLTGCALGIAQTGTIILDGGPIQGRRVLSLLPDFHLCVVCEHQVVGLVPEAIAALGDMVRETGRPITFVSGPSATSDIELNRVEGVHGPRTLEVLLVAAVEEGK